MVFKSTYVVLHDRWVREGGISIQNEIERNESFTRKTFQPRWKERKLENEHVSSRLNCYTTHFNVYIIIPVLAQ